MSSRGKRRRGSDDVELARIANRYGFLNRLAPAVWIAAFYFPLREAVRIARALSGKNTSVQASITISVVVSVALGGAYVAQMLKNHRQGRELQRLRQRCTDLENELAREKA